MLTGPEATALGPDSPKKGLVLHSSGRWEERKIPTSSQRAWIPFGRPCWSVHGSGRVCTGSAGSWSIPVVQYSCWARQTGIPEPLGAVTPGIFGADGRVWAPALRPDLPKKDLVSHSSSWRDERQITTSSQQSNLTVSDGHFYKL